VFGNEIMPSCCFLFYKNFNKKKLLNLIEKTKQTFVLLVLLYCVFVITSFNLWMSKGAHEVFALVVKFLGEDWMLKRIIMGCLKHLIL